MTVNPHVKGNTVAAVTVNSLFKKYLGHRDSESYSRDYLLYCTVIVNPMGEQPHCSTNESYYDGPAAVYPVREQIKVSGS